MNPEELHYTQSHEWVRIDGDVGTIGITDYAQKELGEIVYLEMPEVGHVFNADEEFGRSSRSTRPRSRSRGSSTTTRSATAG